MAAMLTSAHYVDFVFCCSWQLLLNRFVLQPQPSL
jgi:hypothetical protein